MSAIHAPSGSSKWPPAGVTQHDEIDDIDINVDPYEGDPPSRRSDRELSRILSILDELENGKGNG